MTVKVKYVSEIEIPVCISDHQTSVHKINKELLKCQLT